MKIITGPRRAGKSVFAIEILKDTNFGYVNFDDERLLNVDNDELIKTIHEVYGDINFLLFDEIQNLAKWELFVNRLHRLGYNIFLTGSNSKLLSSEMATHLTGRYVPINIYTFSFNEFLKANNIEISGLKLSTTEKGKILNQLSKYQTIGGYPEVVLEKVDYKNYLNVLFDSMILKDIVKRYNVKYTQNLYTIAKLLASNYASEFSYNKLKNFSEIGSVHTIKNYVSYLEEAYLFFYVNRFSFKPKEQLKYPSKIYLYDTGMASALSLSFSKDLGKLMENRVAIELKRQQKEFYYYKDPDNIDVDFVIKENNEVCELMQVSYDINNEKTKEREVKSLMKSAKKLNVKNLSIITWDYESVENIDNLEIKFVPLWKWLFLLQFN
ncbi:MAG: ATP-binding protein [Bacteroidales bacterium]